MNAVVTGCAGFIGSHLVDALLAAGWNVIGYDNLSTGNIVNLRGAMESRRFVFYETDVRSDFKIPNDTSVIFHLAALGSVPRSLQSPSATYDHNVMPLARMADKIKNWTDSPRIVFASSSSVYGDHHEPLRYEMHTGRATSPYAASKQAQELIADSYARSYPGVTLVGLRFFNVFGPRQDPQSQYSAVIPKWAHAMLVGRPVEILGDPDISRDFTPVREVVRAMMLAATARLDPGFHPLNVGTGVPTTLGYLFDQLRKLTGYPFGPIIRAGRPGDVRESRADCSQALRKINFKAAVSFDASLAEVVACMRPQIAESVDYRGLH